MSKRFRDLFGHQFLCSLVVSVCELGCCSFLRIRLRTRAQADACSTDIVALAFHWRLKPNSTALNVPSAQINERFLHRKHRQCVCTLHPFLCFLRSLAVKEVFHLHRREVSQLLCRRIYPKQLQNHEFVSTFHKFSFRTLKLGSPPHPTDLSPPPLHPLHHLPRTFPHPSDTQNPSSHSRLIHRAQYCCLLLLFSPIEMTLPPSGSFSKYPRCLDFSNLRHCQSLQTILRKHCCRSSLIR